MLADNLTGSKPRSGVTLSHPGIAFPAKGAQQLSPYLSVTDIGFSTVTENGRGIAPADADVVKHGRFLQELAVEHQFGMMVTDQQTTVGDLPRMLQEQSSQVVVLWIVLVNYRLIVHL